MRISEGISMSYSTCKVRNGNVLKMCVSEIRVKRIHVNQGLDVHHSRLFKSKKLKNLKVVSTPPSSMRAPTV